MGHRQVESQRLGWATRIYLLILLEMPLLQGRRRSVSLEGQAAGACSFDELGVVLDDSGHVSGGGGGGGVAGTGLNTGPMRNAVFALNPG